MEKNNNKREFISGFTNKTYLVKMDNKVYLEQEKTYNGLNHRINYKILKEFDFVPKLIFEDEKCIRWEFIDMKNTIKTDENIIRIAKILKVIHSSSLVFPKNNIKNRQLHFLKEASKVNAPFIPKEIKEYWDVSLKLRKLLDTNTPIHSDPWLNNFIGDATKDGIYFVDWEYAIMGDLHWDLAYFIDSALLNEREKCLFLKTYGKYDEKKLAIASFLVNFISIIWIFQYKDYKNIFPYQPLLDRVIKLYPELRKMVI